MNLTATLLRVNGVQRRVAVRISELGVLLAVIAGAGCVADLEREDVRLTGTIAGPGGASGRLEVDIHEVPVVYGVNGAVWDGNASGVVTWSTGGSVPLSGSFDPSTGSLELSGGGYWLTATVVDGQATGEYAGPDGSGGTFVVTIGDTVEVYCGTYAGAADGHRGIWNVVRSGPSIGGIYHDEATDEGAVFYGAMDSDGVHFTVGGGSATGMLENGEVSGTYGDGSFSGSAEGCE